MGIALFNNYENATVYFYYLFEFKYWGFQKAKLTDDPPVSLTSRC